MVRKLHHVYAAKDGHIARSGKTYIHGERSGWYVDGILKGDMLDMLKRTSGSICVPVTMVSQELVSAYHQHGLQVSVFSYVNLATAKADKDAMNIDTYFVDDKCVFDAL